jgi:hypothetical protein
MRALKPRKAKAIGSMGVSLLITQLLSTMTLCPLIIPSHPCTSERRPVSMGHIIPSGLNPSVWKVVCTGVEFPEEGEMPDYNQLQQIHYNAQASNVLLSSLEKDEYDHVDGLEKASEIWETLWRFHEGSIPVCKAKVAYEAYGQQSDGLWFKEVDQQINGAKIA